MNVVLLLSALTSKTTFFNCITGIYEPTEGNVKIRRPGNDDFKIINGKKPNDVTALGMARTFQNIRLFHTMSVLENVMIGCHCRAKAGILGALFRSAATKREEKEIIDKSYELLRASISHALQRRSTQSSIWRTAPS